MAPMNVLLPDPMQHWFVQQAQTGQFSSASDYVRDLIRRDQARAGERAELQRLIAGGIDSGVSAGSMDDILRAALEQGTQQTMAWRLSQRAVQDMEDIVVYGAREYGVAHAKNTIKV